MSSSSSSSSAAIPLDHLAPSPTDQLCYVHCNCCDAILAVRVPSSSLFKTVTVRCGHCASMLSLNLHGILLPPAARAPSVLMNQDTAATSRSNSSCGSNLPAAPMPEAKPPVQQEPELTKSSSSVNRRKD